MSRSTERSQRRTGCDLKRTGRYMCKGSERLLIKGTLGISAHMCKSLKAHLIHVCADRKRTHMRRQPPRRLLRYVPQYGAQPGTPGVPSDNLMGFVSTVPQGSAAGQMPQGFVAWANSRRHAPRSEALQFPMEKLHEAPEKTKQSHNRVHG